LRPREFSFFLARQVSDFGLKRVFENGQAKKQSGQFRMHSDDPLIIKSIPFNPIA
jgi:hypothetical protein